MEAFTDSRAEEMQPLGVQVCIIEPGNYNSEIGRAAVVRAGLDSRMADRSKLKEPDEVAAALRWQLLVPVPKRRYFGSPNEDEAEYTIRKQIRSAGPAE